MNLVENIGKQDITNQKSAALYYKTEPFVTDISRYTHTNNWEILCCVEILNNLGYVVDVIDRDNSSWISKKKYDLFLGLGVGNSGKNFVRYAKESGADKKILLSMGPQPDISNELVVDRYKQFNKRCNMNAPTMRTVSDVIGDKFLDIIDSTTAIFNIGEKENESYKSYQKYGKKIYSFYPAISPAVSYNEEWLTTRKRNSFLCFAGNGLICKGVDILVESFLKNEHLDLNICGPAETAFF